MKLIALTLKNFRSYKESTSISFDELTTIIGRNDIGKSTILEALDIFFGGGVVKCEKTDISVSSTSNSFEISCEFSDLPDSLSLDSGGETSLAEEFLLTSRDTLYISKLYDCSGSGTPKVETFIIANHPTAEGLSDLLQKKEVDLQKLIDNTGLEGPKKGNAKMRKALWSNAPDLKLDQVSIPATKAKEDCKEIWSQLEKYLPLFALFRSDRQSRDSDGEVQSPLKGAIANAIAEAQKAIDDIQELVEQKATEIAELTQKAVAEIDPQLARTLNPIFAPPTPSKWASIFSLGMETDDGIPLNKRGSGVRRLILIGFFKAEAERRLTTTEKANIIYAIEEPETSQHPSNQRILIDSLVQLAESDGCQIILTTHSPGLASNLPSESVRFISQNENGETPIISEGDDVFGEVADTLGLTPDSRVKLLVCVEGPTDVQALKCLSKALHANDQDLPNLADDSRVAFVPMGGGTLKHWVNENYLKALNLPEVHIYDNDVLSYNDAVVEVNGRTDNKGSWAVLTNKHEIESYLHQDALQIAFGFSCNIVDFPDDNNPAVDQAFSEAHEINCGNRINTRTAKKKLAARAFPVMTADMLNVRDPAGEVRDWMVRIRDIIDN